jgi:tRNA(adenine34) deaminase
LQTEKDFIYMKLALDEAKLAYSKNEVPVGAVLVKNDEVISRSHNQSISKNDPSGHAEMNALRDAAKKIDNYRLNGASLYVTLEPCLMCFGACIHSRIDRLIFATEDQKSGVVINNLNLKEESFFNHKISVSSGILATESSELLKKFFQERRN